MAKVMLFILVALLSVSIITAAVAQQCGRHGDPCVSSSNCCSGTVCHRYANRCQAEITAEDLKAQKRLLKQTNHHLWR